jgi:hypothetical protein
VKWLRWVWSHWYIPVLAVVAAVGWAIGRSHRRPGDAVATELETIEATEAIRRLQIEKGAAIANAMVELKYQAVADRLSERERAMVQGYWHDPVSRMRALARLSGKRAGKS